ncbi:MAG TPA: V-type ATPase subunit [Gemmatimonadales bacterium]|nr:V-type ATPase subunit [Gemmatimonadales bacterium]
MTARWEDVNARCRGLGTHLLGRAELAAVEAAVEWRALPRLLQPHLAAPEPPSTPRELDAALLRRYGSALAVVERWLGPRRRLLRVVWEDEERRTLRSLLRGAAEGASVDRRLEGAVATARLPGRLLRRLAGARTAADGVALAAATGLPLAAAVARIRIGPGAAGLLELEIALSRAWAERAIAGARGGGRAFRGWVGEAIDAENVLALSLAGSWIGELPPEEAWLPGGRNLGRVRFAAIARVADDAARAGQLRQVFRRGPIRAALDAAADPADLERQLLDRRTAAAGAGARREPLGPWPTCWFLLRSRLELERLRRASWALAFGPGGAQAAPAEAA